MVSLHARGDARELVRVVGRRLRHREHRARPRVEHDRGRALRAPLRDGLRSTCSAFAWIFWSSVRNTDLPGRAGTTLSILIGRPNGSRTTTCEPSVPRSARVEQVLEPGQALVVDPGVAEHLRRDGVLRIAALLLAVEPEARELLAGELRGDQRIRLALHVRRSARERSASSGYRSCAFRPRMRGRDARLGERVAHLARVGEHRRRLLAERERRSHAVEDRAAACRQDDGRLRLHLRHRRERLGAHGRDPRRAREQRARRRAGCRGGAAGSAS